MKKYEAKFRDFQADKLSKAEQKSVQGGDPPTPIDPPVNNPSKGNGGTGNPLRSKG